MNFGRNYASVTDNNLYRRKVNPNLVGMNTQFKNNVISGNAILQNKTKYENAMLHNNVISKSNLKTEFINKPNKVILYKSFGTENNTHTFLLNETLNDTVCPVNIVNDESCVTAVVVIVGTGIIPS